MKRFCVLQVEKSQNSTKDCDDYRPKELAPNQLVVFSLESFSCFAGYRYLSINSAAVSVTCSLVQDWLGPEGQKIYDSLDWSEDEDVNDYDLMWTKLERAVSPECNEIVEIEIGMYH